MDLSPDVVLYANSGKQNEIRIVDINNRLSRRITARGSCTGLVTVGPTKVKARKSILFTEAKIMKT